MGVRFADGTGNEMVNYILGFKKLSYQTALFCDSDCTNINNRKQEFRDIDIKVIDSEDGYSIEQQVFKDATWGVVKELIQIAINKIVDDGGKTTNDADKQIFETVNARLNDKMTYADNWYEEERDGLRTALGMAAKKNEWYKRQTYGELMGHCILTSYSDLAEGCKLKHIIDNISNWIDS